MLLKPLLLASKRKLFTHVMKVGGYDGRYGYSMAYHHGQMFPDNSITINGNVDYIFGIYGNDRVLWVDFGGEYGSSLNIYIVRCDTRKGVFLTSDDKEFRDKALLNGSDNGKEIEMWISQTPPPLDWQQI